jgi:predicted dienelactone hydrolase
MVSKSAFFAIPFCTLVLLPLPSQASDAGPAGLDLPQPDGCHPVGTRVIVLRDPHRSRELVVSLWYPAAAGKYALAPYMDRVTAGAVAEAWKLKTDFERHVHTQGKALAPIAPGGPFPVVFLEHGSGVVPAVYTVLAEGLASSGFIVVAPNHSPDSLISVFPDGHAIRFAPYWPVNADRRAQGEAIGRFAENVLVADVRFVLDQLSGMAQHDGFWRGHLDLSRVGIVGHSMGGTTAGLATRDEPRILAGVNLDGSTYPGMNGDVRPVNVRKPYLFLMTEGHASDPASRGHEFAGKKSHTYYVVVSGADHMSFTDQRMLVSRFSRESPADDTIFDRALLTLQLTRSLVDEFFGKYLKGGTAPNLDLAAHVDKE